jgi:hypothetical protein
VYSLPGDAAVEEIADHGAEGANAVPSFLEPEDRLAGFAYDPFTDHFFLRLAPGNRIRVVDRPARAIKREFTIDGLGAGGDLAARPRDGHLFFLESSPVRVVETTRLGKIVRTIHCESVTAAAGIAVDPERQRLILLHADGRQLTVHDLEGRRLESHRLAHAVEGSLALDAERGELHAPLRGSPARIGVFDLQGRQRRELPVAARFVDVGPRSFLRVF